MARQGDLFGAAGEEKPRPKDAFDGPVYSPALDYKRLNDQINTIFNYMDDRRWHSLMAISQACDAPEASVSAQLRHLRKAKYGNHVVEKKRVEKTGLWLYRMIANPEYVAWFNPQKSAPASESG